MKHRAVLQDMDWSCFRDIKWERSNVQFNSEFMETETVSLLYSEALRLYGPNKYWRI